MQLPNEVLPVFFEVKKIDEIEVFFLRSKWVKNAELFKVLLVKMFHSAFPAFGSRCIFLSTLSNPWKKSLITRTMQSMFFLKEISMKIYLLKCEDYYLVFANKVRNPMLREFPNFPVHVSSR